MSELTIKGMFLKALVDEVRKEKGEPGVEELQKHFGGDLHFSGFRDYPVQTELKLNSAVVKVLYKKVTAETWEQFGRLGFKTYVENPIGKTMISLLGNDLKKLALAIEKAFATVTSGYKFQVDILGDQKIKIIIDNCQDEKEYYVGLFKATVEYFGNIPQVEVKVLDKNKYEYTIAWTEKSD